MKLIIEDDEGRKTVIPIVRDDLELTIGRQEGNAIRLTERNISRQHARLSRKNGSVFIEDLGSYNGVKVNGDKIKGTIEIKQGDLVQIGDYDLAIQEETARDPLDSSRPTPVLTPAVTVPNARLPNAGEGSAKTEPSIQIPDHDLANQQTDKTPAVKRDKAAAQTAEQLAEAGRQSTAIINVKNAQRSARAVAEIPEDQAPRLCVTTTEFAGREYPCLRTEVRVGRTEENDIAIDHRSLSRSHCKLIRDEEGEWKILDLQSANGVKVNGEQYAEAPLRPGDTIELGHVHLKFLAAGQEAMAQTAELVTATTRAPAKGNKAALLAIAGVAALVIVGGVFYATRNPAPVVERIGTGGPARPLVTPPLPPSGGTQQQAGTTNPAGTGTEPAHATGHEQAQGAGTGENGTAARNDESEAPPPPDPAGVAAFEQGKKLMDAHKFTEAEKKLELAAEKNIDGADPLLAQAREEIQAQKRLADARKLLAKNDLAGARAELESIPADSSFAAQAGEVLAQVTKKEQAPKATPTAAKPPLDENQRKEQALEELATGKSLASKSSRRFKEAIPYFQRAMQLDPALTEAHLYMGICYGQLGTNEKDPAKQAEKMKKAAFHYEEFVFYHPTHPNAGPVKQILRQYFESTGEKPRRPLAE